MRSAVLPGKDLALCLAAHAGDNALHKNCAHGRLSLIVNWESRVWLANVGVTRLAPGVQEGASSPFPLLRLLHLLQHLHRFADLFVEISSHQSQYIEDQRVTHRIENLIAGFARYNDLPRPQNGKMLGKIGLFEPQAFHKGSCRDLPVLQLLEDGEAGGMTESLEDLGFELAKRVGHTIIIFEASHIAVGRTWHW